MLQLIDFSLRRGRKQLIEQANLTIHPGQRVGITGANGTGKSSLFACIRGEIGPDAGDCLLPPGWTLASVRQETPATGVSALDYVLEGDAELQQLQQAIASAEAHNQGEELGRLHARLEAIDGYQASYRAARLLHGLGFADTEMHNPVHTFSGGWRMRLNLAQALMCRSDLLLLDEPTNHLDLETVLWLEDWLRAYPGTLLLISHDREFLDRVVTHIAHIEQHHIELFSGNYSSMEKARAERLAQQQAAYDKQQREIAHIQSFVRRFKAKASKAKQAQSRVKTLERMELIAPAHIDSPFHFAFQPPDRLPNPLLSLDQVAVGYGDTPQLSDIRLTLHPQARIGLLGINGAGKSTFIKLLAGELAAQRGQVEAAADLKIGYFAQHQLDQLHPEMSALQHLQRLDKRAPEQQLRDFLGGFGFNGDRALEPAAPFSGGEKARLVLALLVYQRPNLLLLDEPTNHLDLDMRLALNLALQEFGGGLVVVSHDRYLLESVADDFLLVADGRVQPFDGDLDDYRAWLAERDRAATTSGATASSSSAQSAASRKEQKRLEAERRQQLAPLRNELKKLEKELDRLTDAQAELETRLADTDLYSEARKAELKDLLQEKADTDRRLGEVETRWLAVSEELEAADAPGMAKGESAG